MAEHEPFTWFGAIPGLKELPLNTVTFGFVTLVLIVSAIGLRSTIRRYSADTGLPTGVVGRMTVLMVKVLRDFLRGLIGRDADRYVPFIGSLFLAVLVSNLLGLVPGFLPPTSLFKANIGIAVVTFIYYNAVGIKTHGWKYVKQFTGPVIYIAPLTLVIELFSHAARPITLSIRLMANILADHMAFEIFSGLVPVLVPAALLMLGTLVALVQAFIFATLPAAYIALASSHEH